MMTGHRLSICLIAAATLVISGCGSKKSSLLLQRQAVGPLAEEHGVAKSVQRGLEPLTQSASQAGIDVEVLYASPDYLKTFFSNRKIFGPYAGKSPYATEQIVFYLKIANRSEQKIRISPEEFVLVDDRGNQYGMIGVDYIMAFAESRAATRSAVRGAISEARPGYFGFSLPVGKIVGEKSQGPYALLQMASVQTGYLYPGVVHDGLIAFWNPTVEATKLSLVLANIKTGFDADDRPTTVLEFPFEFHLAH